MLKRLLAIGVVSICASMSHAQLRIVTYNTNTFGTQGLAPGLPSNFRTVRPEADIVFEAIGEETVNGIQRPADIILLQEQQQVGSTTENLLQRLNAIYANQGITYARGQLNPGTTSDPGPGAGTGPGGFDASEIRQSVIYRTDSVQLIDEQTFGDLSGGLISHPRETLFLQFRPVGFGADADLFIFNSHFEAGDDDDIVSGVAENLAGRETEANQIRTFIDNNNLGDSNVIVAGDLNVDSNFETSGLTAFGGQSALQILSAAGSGRVLDPVFPCGQNVTFTNNSSLAELHTQSPANDGSGPLTGGGIDDRFDFILQSDELLDGEGVASIPDSLRAFGNNGSTFNDEINDGNTIQIQGLTSFTTAQVLNALEAASDHLPVIEDFQLPAILGGSAMVSDETVELGGDAELLISIENVSPVDVSIGADELEYAVTVTGDASLSESGDNLLVGDLDEIVIPLDTSIAGTLNFEVTLTTSSPGSPVTSLVFTPSIEVLAGGLAGDFNGDGTVNAADYTVWRDGLATGDFTLADFNDFVANFGSSGAAASAAVAPEPSASLLAAAFAMLVQCPRRRGR